VCFHAGLFVSMPMAWHFPGYLISEVLRRTGIIGNAFCA